MASKNKSVGATMYKIYQMRKVNSCLEQSQGWLPARGWGSKFNKMGAAWGRALLSYVRILILSTQSRLLCRERRAWAAMAGTTAADCGDTAEAGRAGLCT